MKKVGIITVHGYHNYGNRLQNYAVQKIIEELGFEAITLKTKTALVTIKPTIIQSLYNNRKNLPNKIKSKFIAKKYKSLTTLRLQKFKNFTEKYIKETSSYITNNSDNICLDDKYDFFITGSDQVWNPVLKGTDIEFLQFVSSQKRIAFSASIGTSFIPEERIEYYQKALNAIPSISVREYEAKSLIETLTQRDDIEVIVDPTMLLSKHEWFKLCDNSLKKPKKYILVYFLGQQSAKYRSFIQKIARGNNLDIVELLNPKYEDYYLADPAEFVELINDAALICTDSFHGAAFSITLNKQFVVFDRIETEQPSMNSRITTLLQKFSLQDRYWNSDYKINRVFKPINYKTINDILTLEKKKAIDFLKKSLDV